MERKQCEELILEKLKEIKDIYLQYNCEGEYLSLCIIKQIDMFFIFFNNSYDGKDKNKPIDFYLFEKTEENKK